MTCAWPADRKGCHKTMDCCRPILTTSGTANFPKAKEYQKMKIGACELDENQQDLYTEGSGSKELSRKGYPVMAIMVLALVV